MNCVIDASVLVKFFIPEILSEKAEELNALIMEGDLRLLAGFNFRRGRQHPLEKASEEGIEPR